MIDGEMDNFCRFLTYILFLNKDAGAFFCLVELR